MKQHSIILTDHEARGMAAGTVSQLWRPVKFGHPGTFKPTDTPGYDFCFRGNRRGGTRGSGACCWQDHRTATLLNLCPYGAPGDVLVCRETWFCNDYRYPIAPLDELREAMEYRAGHNCDDWEGECPCRGVGPGWKSPATMLSGLARHRPTIASVRVVRLGDVTDGDAQAWGCPPGACGGCGTAIAREACIGCQHPFWKAGSGTLWDRLYGKAFPSASSPWIWQITIQRSAPTT